SNNALAVLKDGSLWAWGSNSSGQLGDGTTTDMSSPERVGSTNDWAQVAGGYSHTVAIKKDGSLWTWGSDDAGELGTGTVGTASATPGRIGEDTNWSAIAAGYDFNAALKKD